MGRRSEAVRGFPHPAATRLVRSPAPDRRGPVRSGSGTGQPRPAWCRTCCRGSANSREPTTVNQYGEMARRHWARWLPDRFAAIEDPESVLHRPGEPRPRQRIDALAWDTGGGRPAGRGVPGQGRAAGRGPAPGRADRAGRDDPAAAGTGSRGGQPASPGVASFPARRPGRPGPVGRGQPGPRQPRRAVGPAHRTARAPPRDACRAGGAGPLVGVGRGAGGVR